MITPLIVHWPAVKVKKGLISHEPVHLIDIIPTLPQIAGASYPESFQGQQLIPVMGQTFVPLLNGAQQDPQKTMFWEHEGNQAIRVGDMKLVRRHNRDWELYNMALDPTELYNIAADNPYIFQLLRAK